MMNKKLISIAIASAALSLSAWTQAAVSVEEAARLGNDLTPVGAEKAGNADGSIPAWTGGLTGGKKVDRKDVREALFADEKPLFTITAANMDQYAGKLTDADKALLQAYPNDFKMNVYTSHRTAAWPQYVYDNIKAAATAAELADGGDAVTGVWAAIPFPIPKNGHEVVWNHMLRYQGLVRSTSSANELIYYNDGTKLDYSFESEVHYTYYDPNVSEKDKAEGKLFNYVSATIEPARDKGDGFLVFDYINPKQKPRAAWAYDPGERRVRRAPSLQFDTPNRPIDVVDDFDLFAGSPERYDFKLIGKQEMFVPYNNNRVNQQNQTREEVYTLPVVNPDLIRYELHRVWVVEATVKEGARHVYAKRKFYIDEDTWTILATAKYDNAGNLWRVGYKMPMVAPEVPVTAGGMELHYDLKIGGMYAIFGVAGEPETTVFDSEPKPSAYYSTSGMRRRGR